MKTIALTSRTIRNALLLVGWLASSALQDVSAADTELDLDARAATSAISLRDQVRQESRWCGEKFGKEGYAFPFIEHFWESSNYAAFHGADSVSLSLKPADKTLAEHRSTAATAGFNAAVFARLTKDGLNAECSALIHRLNDRSQRLQGLDPADGQRLEAIFAREADAFAIRNDGMTTGCIKKSYNSGAKDFGAARRLCECNTQALLSSASNAEIDKFLTDVHSSPGKPDTLQRQPWFPVALEKLKSCAASP